MGQAWVRSTLIVFNCLFCKTGRYQNAFSDSDCSIRIYCMNCTYRMSAKVSACFYRNSSFHHCNLRLFQEIKLQFQSHSFFSSGVHRSSSLFHLEFFWLYDFNFYTFQILFSNFFFNDHSIQWVIQYMHTTTATADSVIHLDT